MAKAPDAFRTISEVAEWLDTPAHVLRFWESKFSQVKPVKRAGGRRYYRPDDMALLGGIKMLLHDDGLTIKGVQKLLREKGVRHVMSFSPPIAGDQDTAAVEHEETPVLPDSAAAYAPANDPGEPPAVAAPEEKPQDEPFWARTPSEPDPEVATEPESTPAPAPVTPVAIPLTQGILAPLLAARPSGLSERAAKIAPLALKLQALADRMDRPGV
jgi:DNA-binding transcriptional MerR regulator